MAASAPILSDRFAQKAFPDSSEAKVDSMGCGPQNLGEERGMGDYNRAVAGLR